MYNERTEFCKVHGVFTYVDGIWVFFKKILEVLFIKQLIYLPSLMSSPILIGHTTPGEGGSHTDDSDGM